MTVKLPTRIIIYVLKSDSDKTLEKSKGFGYKVRQMMTLHILQYSYSLITGLSKCFLCINYINCNTVDDWKKCTNLLTVNTQFVQKWSDSGTVCCAVQR